MIDFNANPILYFYYIFMVQKLNMHEILDLLSPYVKTMTRVVWNAPGRLDRIMNLDPIEAF